MAWWRSILGLAMGGAGAIEYKKDANIFSDYNLCVFPVEEITAIPTSTYILCIEQKEYLTAALASVYNICTPHQESLTAALASTYSLVIT